MSSRGRAIPRGAPAKTCRSRSGRSARAQVRDRATLYLAELGGKAGGAEAVDVHWDLPARNLEKSLRAYLDNGGEAPFSLVRLIRLHPGRASQRRQGGPSVARAAPASCLQRRALSAAC